MPVMPGDVARQLFQFLFRLGGGEFLDRLAHQAVSARLRVFFGRAASATSRLAAARASAVTLAPGQHAGDLLQPGLVFQQRDAGLVADPGNAEMPRRAGRHLRGMGDQQHLGGFRQPLQPLAHRIGHRAADAAIHFVEHQHAGRRGLR